MKKTVSVNIKGFNFIIEEDAYELLEQYLNRLQVNLQSQKGSKEIIEDIELRIAELCQQSLSEKKQVIEKEDIKFIIKTLGEPEDFIDLDSEDEEDGQQDSAKNVKHLYRDIQNGKIAGICSGLSNYFQIDVVIIRIIFLLFLFFGGFGFPLYIILWLVIPKTNSTIDRLKMQGKPITLNNVKEEIEQAAKKITSSSKSFAEKIKKDEHYKKRFYSLGRLISSVIGAGLLMIGIFFLILFFISFFGGLHFIPIASQSGSLSVDQLGDILLKDPSDLFFAYIGSLIVTFSIILFFISNGVFLLNNIKSKWTKNSSLCLFSFGIIGMCMCIYISIKTARDMVSKGEIEKKIGSLNVYKLIIKPIKKSRLDLEGFEVKNSRNFQYENFIILKENALYDGGVKFIYRPSKDSLYHIYQNFSSNSFSHENALFKAKRIKHEIRLDTNELLVNPEFYFPKKDKIRGQCVTVIIEIPKNKSVYIENQKINSNFSDENEKMGYLPVLGEYEQWD